MAITKYNMHGKIEETIKVAEKALFEAQRAHARINALPPAAVPETPAKGEPGKRGERGQTGKDGAACFKGDKGDRGERGERGDVLIPNESELAAAVIQLRQEKARWLAALAVQLERNSGRKHPGLRSAVASVLSTLKSDSQ